MRGLVSAGANSNDLRALEDLVEYLARPYARVARDEAQARARATGRGKRGVTRDRRPWPGPV